MRPYDETASAREERMLDEAAHEARATVARMSEDGAWLPTAGARVGAAILFAVGASCERRARDAEGARDRCATWADRYPETSY